MRDNLHRKVIQARAIPWEGQYAVAFDFDDRFHSVIMVGAKEIADAIALNAVGKGVGFIDDVKRVSHRDKQVGTH